MSGEDLQARLVETERRLSDAVWAMAELLDAFAIALARAPDVGAELAPGSGAWKVWAELDEEDREAIRSAALLHLPSIDPARVEALLRWFTATDVDVSSEDLERARRLMRRRLDLGGRPGPPREPRRGLRLVPGGRRKT